MRSWFAIAVSLAACGDDGGTAGPKDAPPVFPDIDNGSCGDQLRFTGEIVDWDETEAAFCGVGEASVTDGPDGNMDTTAPNGRFDLCIPTDTSRRGLTVTPSANNSQCATPVSSYAMPGLLVATKDVILSGAKTSGRMFTEARKADFFMDMGITENATAGHVLVYTHGTPKKVSLSQPASAPWRFDGTTWAAGDTGRYVFFANVTAGTVMVNVEGGAIGTGEVPVAAATITMVSVNSQ